MATQVSKPVLTAGLAATGQAVAPIGMTSGNNLRNGQLVATVSSNALTIAIQTLSGDTPSPQNPVFVSFLDTVGTEITLTVDSETKAVYADDGGSNFYSFGVSIAWYEFALWAVAIKDGTSVRIGAVWCDGEPHIEDAGIADIAFGDLGDGLDGTVKATIYSTAALSGALYRTIGRMEWQSGLAVVGRWTVGPDLIKLQAPGLPLPGDLVYREPANISALQSFVGATLTPLDNSLPTDAEGNEVFTADFVPRSACNYVEVEADFHCSYSVDTTLIAHMIINGGSAFTVGANAAIAGKLTQVSLHYNSKVQSAAPEAYKFRLGAPAAGNLTLHGVAGGLLFNSRLFSRIVITEYQG